MRYLVISLLAIAALAIAEETKQVCEPGRAFQKYCNTCACSDDGKQFACTRNFCPPGLWNEDGSMIADYEDPTADAQDCEPGEFFMEYCNHCRCSNDGRNADCTYITCPPGMYHKNGTRIASSTDDSNALLRMIVKRELPSTKTCTPGQTYKSYCNDCICNPDGKTRSCSLIACPQGLYNEDGTRNDVRDVIVDAILMAKRELPSTKTCTPGQTYKSYCNDCVCNADGTTRSCTYIACPPGLYNEDGTRNDDMDVIVDAISMENRELASTKTCTPGQTYKSYCNDCICNADGTTRSCTYIACPPGHYNEDGTLTNIVEDKSPQYCQPGTTVMVDCNSCVCSAEGKIEICTRMRCDI